MIIGKTPRWMSDLNEEEWELIKQFILSSGSLKEVAQRYEVTYPTVRLRLDRLIHKIELSDQAVPDSYLALIKELTLDNKLDLQTAQLLIEKYREREAGE